MSDPPIKLLFGGAIAANIPPKYLDVSTLRQVPDNQEVYLDPDGSTSITVDILERVENVGTDEGAIRYHLEDIVEAGDEIRLWSITGATFTKLPAEVPALSLFATVKSDTSGPSKPDFTAILLVLARLKSQATDIVILLNVPHVPGLYDPTETNVEHGKLGTLIEQAISTRDEIISSFEVQDWSLFA